MIKCDVCGEEQKVGGEFIFGHTGKKHRLEVHDKCLDRVILGWREGDNYQGHGVPPGYAHCLSCGSATKETRQDSMGSHYCEACSIKLGIKA